MKPGGREAKLCEDTGGPANSHEPATLLEETGGGQYKMGHLWLMMSEEERTRFVWTTRVSILIGSQGY